MNAVNIVLTQNKIGSSTSVSGSIKNLTPNILLGWVEAFPEVNKFIITVASSIELKDCKGLVREYDSFAEAFAVFSNFDYSWIIKQIVKKDREIKSFASNQL